MTESPGMIDEYQIRLHQLNLLNEISKHILSYSDFVQVNKVIEKLILEYNKKLNNTIQRELEDAIK